MSTDSTTAEIESRCLIELLCTLLRKSVIYSWDCMGESIFTRTVGTRELVHTDVVLHTQQWRVRPLVVNETTRPVSVPEHAVWSGAKMQSA